jgi:hypothetical protein
VVVVEGGAMEGQSLVQEGDAESEDPARGDSPLADSPDDEGDAFVYPES